MTTATIADRAAEAALAGLAAIARAAPEGRHRPESTDVDTIITSAPIPTLNGVFTRVHRPDLARVIAAADDLKSLALPWTIQVRGAAGAGLTAVGASFGLTRQTTLPLMVCRPDDLRPGSSRHDVTVSPPADGQRYVEALATGFEAPLEVFSDLLDSGLLSMPDSIVYVVEDAGEIVGTGFGLVVGDWVGVHNIATAPSHRRRGIGRAITERAARDGFAAGASTAYLQAMPAAVHLYESMGFETVETWTYLTA